MPDAETTGIEQLQTGVPGLDEVLGGGLPEDAFTLVSGGPGTGKTTLVQQLLFHRATVERPALFFTVLGEPTVKLVRHQRQFSFFSNERIGTAVHLVCLTHLVGYGFDAYLAAIEEHIQRVRPAFVAVDSFRAVMRSMESPHPVDLERFVQGLGLLLTSHKMTSFLIGEYGESEVSNPVFTVADVILSLRQAVDGNSIVRKLQLVKSRGQAGMPGLHTFRITDDGLQVFPRIPTTGGRAAARPASRLTMGLPRLDELMGGGLPRGDVLLVAGPTGSGKTTLAMQFALDGVERGESVVVLGFEEQPREVVARARALGGPDFDLALDDGRFHVLSLRPLDLSVDEAIFELQQAVGRTGATRVVIDSLAGFEVALAPTFRVNFRESLCRLLGVMKVLGVTVLLTNEVSEGDPDQHLTRHGVSLLCDDIVLIRYVEYAGECRQVLAVRKMRTSRHSRGFHPLQTSATGIQLGPALGSSPGRKGPAMAPARPIDFHGLTEEEAVVGHAIRRAGSATRSALLGILDIDGGALDGALDRLVLLGYAGFAPAEGGGAYAVRGRPLP